MQNAKKVILNTGFLYGKMVISIFIALYSTRIVLSALGVADFGIFNLVGGVIAMLSFLNLAMTTSTQRFMSYYLGAGDGGKLNEIFRSSFLLHFIIGVLVVILLEIASFFLFDGFLKIPFDRLDTAKTIYHFMVISTFFTINAVPYDAVINAHENMLFDALTGIFESFLKLGIAFSLLYNGFDKLVLYGLLMAVLTIVMRVIKSLYCSSNYEECKLFLKRPFDKSLLKEMFSFAGWNLFGALCNIGTSQGMAVILNLFFGTLINAAYAIANQVNGQLYAFAANMLKALGPQIMKSEGSGDRQGMLNLSMLASKYGFYLLAFFAIPLIFEMPFVINLWLSKVPNNTIVFCRLVLLATMANMITVGLQTAIQSVGNIKLYQTVMGSLLLLNLPVGWLLLKLGNPPYSVLISLIVIELIAGGFRIFFLKLKAGLSVADYINKVVVKIIIVMTITIIGSFIPYYFLEQGFLRLFMLSFFSALIFVISLYNFGMDKNEKVQIDGWIRYKIKSKK
jgi:O-antigen/teichoic acid export membrane protein